MAHIQMRSFCPVIIRKRRGRKKRKRQKRRPFIVNDSLFSEDGWKPGKSPLNVEKIKTQMKKVSHAITDDLYTDMV